MMLTFATTFATMAAVFTVAWLPLRFTARRRNRQVAATTFLTIGILLAAFLAAGAAGADREMARCEAAGGIGCGYAAMGAAFGVIVFAFLYVLAVLLAALVVRLRKPNLPDSGPVAVAGSRVQGEEAR